MPPAAVKGGTGDIDLTNQLLFWLFQYFFDLSFG